MDNYLLTQLDSLNIYIPYLIKLKSCNTKNSDLLVKVIFSYMNYTCLNEMANTETATKSIAKSDHGYKKMS